MDKLDNKNVLYGFVGFISLVIAMLIVSPQDAVGAAEQVPFTKLTDNDIDMIIAVQQEMAAARESHNLASR